LQLKEKRDLSAVVLRNMCLSPEKEPGHAVRES